MFENDYYENEDFSDCIINRDELARKKFVKCKFNATDFTDVVTIFNCTFESCDFFSAYLNGVNIKNCVFLSCQFNLANFFATKFDECKMTGSSFLGSDCSLAEIVGGDWSYTELRNLDFSKQKFHSTRFIGADLTGTRFGKCKFKACEFDEAIMHETSFFGSDIRTSSFDNINFLEVNLKNAKVDLQQCIIIAEALMEVRFIPEKKVL